MADFAAAPTAPVPGIDRTDLRRAYAQDEEACIAERLEQAAPAARVHENAARLAIDLIEALAGRRRAGSTLSSSNTASTPRKASR